MDQKDSLNKIILASASPRRSQLLAEHGIVFDIIVPHVSELSDSSISPHELVLRNAVLKAENVSAINRGRLVLGADTVVALDGTVYGKPRDVSDAATMLGILRGKTHEVFTGVAVSYTAEDGTVYTISDCGKSAVSFKNISDSRIAEYITKVNVLDKAGAYAAQEHGSMIIDKIDGDFDNVMGLPCNIVKNLLDTARLRFHC